MFSYFEKKKEFQTTTNQKIFGMEDGVTSCWLGTYGSLYSVDNLIKEGQNMFISLTTLILYQKIQEIY